MFRRIKRFFDKLFRRGGSSLSFKRRRRKLQKDKIKNVLIWMVELVLVVALAYLCVVAFGSQVQCANVSMEPTINSGDILLINTVSYKIKNPGTNDIIAFKPDSNVNASYSIKRVIGVPGDTVLISSGRLYVNGSLFNEFAKTDLIADAGIAASEITLGEDEYFVLGDNRNLSEDSRYETIGMVSKKDIFGKVWFTISRKK